MRGSSGGPPGLFGRILAFLLGAVTLVLTFMFSLLVFAVVITAVLGLGGYFWWKTRKLRKQLREQPADGHVIEGVAVREADIQSQIEK